MELYLAAPESPDLSLFSLALAPADAPNAVLFLNPAVPVPVPDAVQLVVYDDLGATASLPNVAFDHTVDHDLLLIFDGNDLTLYLDGDPLLVLPDAIFIPHTPVAPTIEFYADSAPGSPRLSFVSFVQGP